MIENQITMPDINNLLNDVITLQEASEILGCADSTLRMQVLKGKYEDGIDYRKAKGVILFNKSVIEKMKKIK